MNVKISVFVICVEAIIYLSSCNLHDCTFKNKNCCFPDQGNVGLTPTNLFKENLSYSLIFKAYFKKIFAAAKASLVFIKNRCRSNRSQMFFKIGALTNFAIFKGKRFCWSLFLIKLQAFRCFPVNIEKFLKAAYFTEHLWWLLLQMHYNFRKTLLNIL